MKQKKKSDVAVLLEYAGSHKGLTFLGLALSAVSMLLSMAPYICIWLVARDLIAVAPDWTRAQDIAQYGWLAFVFAVAGIVLYFAGLMCTHLAACLLSAVISMIAMFSMMGGKNAKLMAEYQAAQDRMTKAGTEYVRGIPVVKIFQQSVYSFKAFQEAIEDYSSKAEHYQGDVCRVPQSINLTFTKGAFCRLLRSEWLAVAFLKVSSKRRRLAGRTRSRRIGSSGKGENHLIPHGKGVKLMESNPRDSIVFSSHGYDLHIDNELVAEDFSALPQTEPIHKGKDLPPVWVIHAASGGDSEAMEQVLRYYDDYMKPPVYPYPL